MKAFLAHLAESLLFPISGPVPAISELGFTLVELMIVVAIIGVLATVGVPTFRKMVQKAKKSEAKVSLGALYTVENAFFSEYGTFGSNIDGIGFTLDGTSATRIYHVGFGTGNCNDASKAAIKPTTATGTGSILNVAFPSYFNSSYVGVLETTHPSAPASGCFTGVVPDDGASFLAAANGMVSSATGAVVDQWSINNNRTLRNEQDGTK